MSDLPPPPSPFQPPQQPTPPYTPAQPQGAAPTPPAFTPLMPPAPAPMPPSRRRGMPVWGWIAIGALGLAAIGGVVVAVTGDDDTTTEVADDTEATEAPDATDATTAPTTTPVTVPATTAPATTAEVTLPSVPQSTVPDTIAIETLPPIDPSFSVTEVAGAPAGITGTHDSPVPAGQIADIGGGWRLQVLEVVPDGTKAVLDESSLNDPPADGGTFSLVRVALGYFGTDEPTSGFLPTINLMGAAGTELDDYCGTVPDAVDLFSDVFAGAVVTGNLCFVTTPGDFPTAQIYAQGDWLSFNDPIALALDPAVAPGSVTAFAGLPGIQPEALLSPWRSAPNPIGTAVDVDAGWTFMITAPAADITDAVVADSSINEPPPDGYRYVGVGVSYTYNGTDAVSQPYLVSTSAVGSTNVALNPDCGSVPGEVDLYSDIIPGASSAGTLCFVVPADDLANGTWTVYARASFDIAPLFFAVM